MIGFKTTKMLQSITASNQQVEERGGNMGDVHMFSVGIQ